MTVTRACRISECRADALQENEEDDVRSSHVAATAANQNKGGAGNRGRGQSQLHTSPLPPPYITIGWPLSPIRTSQRYEYRSAGLSAVDSKR